MMVIGHWIDGNWKLQKRVINFVHIPPPRRGVEISDVVFNCAKEKGIEGKFILFPLTMPRPMIWL